MSNPAMASTCARCGTAVRVESPCRGVERRRCHACGRVEVACESVAAPAGDADSVELVVGWSGASPRASDVRALRQLVPDLAEEGELMEGLANSGECRLPLSERAEAVDLVRRAMELGLKVRGF